MFFVGSGFYRLLIRLLFILVIMIRFSKDGDYKLENFFF